MSDEQAKGGAAPPAPAAKPMTFEEEERAMHTGAWKLPVILSVMVVGIVGGIAAFVITGSAGEEVDAASGQLNRLHTEHFVAFYGCAKVPHEMKLYKSMDDVPRRIAKNAWNSEKRYAGYLRSKCFPQFGEYAAKVSAMATPQDMTAEVRNLAERIRGLRSSWEEFARYLERAEVDEEAHMAAAIPVAKAWQAYSISRNALAKRVTKLQKR